MRTKSPAILDLRDLEGQRFWAAMMIFAGLVLAVYGVGSLMKTTDTSLDQVSELTQRVEHLSKPTVAASPSEPAKT